MPFTENQENFTSAAFLAPSAAWRGKPFWSWNGKLEKDELIRQIHVLKEMGMGGYFMHSRTGLVTPYLGEEWFALTNACVKEGERLGLESWLYDEDRWPSGTAGGRVTENPAFRMKFILMAKYSGDTFDVGDWQKAEKHPLGAWRCRLENEIDIYDVARITPATPASALRGKTVLAFSVRPMASGSFYNGNTYVDTMKREATDAYLRLTHEAYKKHCGQHFGKGIKGIFTDEPHRGPFMSGFSVTPGTCDDAFCLVPWTEALFDTFGERYGTRVEDNLPALFLRENGAPVSPVKAQYAETMLQLFLANFAKPCFDWCQANNLPLTGHVLHENSLSCQVSTNGSVQRYYPWMHIPGIDYLGEHGREYWVAKQVDSTARQFGQKWILSELYGCTGWQMNFESHKAVGVWQALFGVNLRCHHLSWYTMAGESKRDYPASILHQSPWYKHYAFVETWFARLGYFRAQGKPCCDLLVLNPVESLWGRMYPGAIRRMTAKDKRVSALEQNYADCFHFLAGHQIDFDYGDESLLAEHGAVEIQNGKPILRLGAMTYTTVLIAGMDTIRKTTLVLLEAFIQAGGGVVLAGDPPAYVDSVPGDTILSLPIQHCHFDGAAVAAALQGHTGQYVRITDRETGAVAEEVFCQLRTADDGDYLTVLNTNRDQVCHVDISLHGSNGRMVEEWDLETGHATQCPVPKAGAVVFATVLHTSQARCFRIVQSSARTPTQPDMPVRETPAEDGTAKPVILDAPARYTLADRNICVLDVPSWSFAGGAQQPAADILQVDQKVRQLCGVPARAGDMVQPWFRGDKVPPPLGHLTLRYPISVTAGAEETLMHLQLVLETPQHFDVCINGLAIDTSQDAGWWVDIAFRRIPIPDGLLREGQNELVISCEFSEDINLEAFYLLGDFAVDLDGVRPCLGPMPAMLAPASIVEQGFPYYSDSVIYHYDVPVGLIGQDVKVRVPEYEGACLKISSGGASRMVPWRPHEARLTLGKTLDIDVCITRKNTFGPLHLQEARPTVTGPGHFVPGPAQFSLEPNFIPSGLLAPVALEVL